MATIHVHELQKTLAEKSGVYLMDVRTPVEYAQVHVVGARLHPLDKLQPRQLIESGPLSDAEPFYILCKSGQRAKAAAELFYKEGYKHAIVVEGGTQAWIDAGLPVERGASNVISLERQVRIGAGSLVLAGVLLGWFVHPAFLSISAFVGAGLVFAGITDWCGMGLLLAKAPWNQKV